MGRRPAVTAMTTMRTHAKRWAPELDMHRPRSMPTGTAVLLCTNLSVTCSTQQGRGPQHAALCTLQPDEGLACMPMGT